MTWGPSFEHVRISCIGNSWCDSLLFSRYLKFRIPSWITNGPDLSSINDYNQVAISCIASSHGSPLQLCLSTSQRNVDLPPPVLRRWMVLMILGFHVSWYPLSYATLEILNLMHIPMDPTVVGPCTEIRQLRYVPSCVLFWVSGCEIQLSRSLLYKWSNGSWHSSSWAFNLFLTWKISNVSKTASFDSSPMSTVTFVSPTFWRRCLPWALGLGISPLVHTPHAISYDLSN